jgi:hypothetical protein
MMNPLKMVTASALFFTLLVLNPGVSEAATALPPGLLIGDQNGIQVNRDGDYFIKATGLMPGQVIIKELKIKNTEKDATPFKLSMTAEPLESAGPVNMLDKVQLKLELDGAKLYDGRVRGDEDVNMIENAINLGKYAAGDQKIMTITLTVDNDFQLSHEKSYSNIRWHFYAVKGERPDPPKTGESDRNLLLWFCSAVLLLGSLIIVANKKRKNAQ